MSTNKASDLAKLLTAKGIKPTHPRLAILGYLRGRRDHPTVDRIYRDLVRDNPTMSKTTVYNTVKAFLDRGIVNPVTITGTEVRLDCMTAHHHHFLCESCGSIIDLDLVCPNICREEIQGHQVRELHGYFKGTCARCKTNKRL